LNAVGVPIRALEFPGVEIVAGEAEVVANVGDDATGHVAAVPGEGDEPGGAKWVGVVPVASGSAEGFAAEFAQPPVELTAVEGGELFAHGSGREDKFVAEGWWDRASRFQQRSQMRLGGFLKPQHGLALVAPVRMAAGQQRAFGYENAIFIFAHFDLRERNDHDTAKLAAEFAVVNAIRAGR